MFILSEWAFNLPNRRYTRMVRFATTYNKQPMEEEDNGNDLPENQFFSGMNLNRIAAILFVLGIHLIIFLKILVLE